jgi:hypothetical protein
MTCESKYRVKAKIELSKERGKVTILIQLIDKQGLGLIVHWKWIFY